MITAHIKRGVGEWREKARQLLRENIPPEEVIWNDSDQQTLLPGTVRVPKAFLDITKYAGCHRDADRWQLMYRVLWRLTHGEPNLLSIEIDPDVHRLLAMEKAVRRDRHKMTAFVRFRKVVTAEGERFIAWHSPDHFIVHLTAPFFVERFRTMHWTILTPDESVTWDGKTLHFSPGVPKREAPQSDELEELWKTYYASTFNPARMKLKMMKREMPVRHWSTLPETEMIPQLLQQSNTHVENMLNCAATGSAHDFIPKTCTLPQLAEAAKSCRGCELHCNATQTVFGEGLADAKLVFVGEQPGDQEDLSGRPFVGPAGQLFDEILSEIGLDRRKTYVTNTVKHFKFEPRGKRRMHSTPNARDVAACRPWLEAELNLIKPATLVCLGSTAAKALLGSGFSITRQRGKAFQTPWCEWTMATYHPSALLRIPDESAKRAAREAFSHDLLLAKKRLF